MRLRQPYPLILIVGLSPVLNGFVLLRASKPTLDATPESPTVEFRWDGRTPEIKDKDQFRDGIYETLSDEETMGGLLADAMGLWNSVPAAFVELKPVTGEEAKLDSEDQIHSILVGNENNQSTAAYASPTIDPETPNIISDCDVKIADRPVGAKELVYIIAHELGHCLGLGHSHDNYRSIMGYSRDGRDFALGPDDKAAIIYLYPDPDAVPGKPKELVCGGVNGAVTKGRGDALALALFLLLPVGLSFARRRRT